MYKCNMQRDSSNLKKSYCDGELQREKLKQPEDFIQFNTCADSEYGFFFWGGGGEGISVFAWDTYFR